MKQREQTVIWMPPDLRTVTADTPVKCLHFDDRSDGSSVLRYCRGDERFVRKYQGEPPVPVWVKE